MFGVASLGALPGPLYWSQTVQQYSAFGVVLSGTNIMDLGVLPDWPHQTLVRPKVEYCCTVWDQYNGPGTAPILATPKVFNLWCVQSGSTPRSIILVPDSTAVFNLWCGQYRSTPRSIILVPDSIAVFNLWSDKCLVWLVWEHSQIHYIGPRQYINIDQYNGPGSAPRLATPNTCQTKG
jgi:hypothetical protein